MSESFKVKEALVSNYFRHKATADEISNAYGYMNCITLRYSHEDDFSNDIDSLEPKYVVVESANDDISRGDIINWSTTNKYIETMIESGIREDIECLYCHLTDKY